MKAARQQAIVGLLTNHRSLTTEVLTLRLNVSKGTIRRDLSELQIQGKVLRNYSRVRVIHWENQGSGDPFRIRLRSHYAHKVDIARGALTWIKGGMVIALGVNSTCQYLTRQLPDINIHVFINGQSICQELAKYKHTQLISSGGRLERKHGCYANPSLISQLKPLEIDLLIFPCEGIDNSDAFWDPNATNADLRSILLERVSQPLLLVDKSKFNCSGEARIGHLDDVARIVSDTQLIEAIQTEQGNYIAIRPGLQLYCLSRRPPTAARGRRT